MVDKAAPVLTYIVLSVYGDLVSRVGSDFPVVV